MIESIDRALAILQLFLQEERPLGITDISSQLDLQKSTVSRTIETLEARGFVYKQATGKYWLGLPLYSLGMLYKEKATLQNIVYPYAQALVETCRESVHLTTFAHISMKYPQHVILEKIKAPQTIDLAPPVGAIRASYCSASGKCLLAYSPTYRDTYRGCRLQKFTAYTCTDWDVLECELAQIEKQGYAVEKEEVKLGMACVAAPIFQQGKIQAAISISAPIARFSDDGEKRYIQAIVQTAKEITMALQ